MKASGWLIAGVTAAAVLIAPAVALAQDAPGQTPPRRGGVFMDADADGDGKVTYEELKAVRSGMTPERFKMLDSNGDGALTAADRGGRRGPAGRLRGTGPRGPEGRGVPQGQGRPIGPRPDGRRGIIQRIASADADGDGKVSLDELRAVRPGMTPERFKAMDTDGDGYLTANDRPMGVRAPGDGAGPGGGMGPGGPMGLGGPGLLLQKLREADANADKKVTREELKAVVPDFPKDAFDRMDANDDGVLSADDWPMGPGGRRGPGAYGGDPQTRGGMMLRRMLEADADGDGKVTFEEITKRAPRLPKVAFERLDTNNDGVLSAEDRPAVAPRRAPAAPIEE